MSNPPVTEAPTSEDLGSLPASMQNQVLSFMTLISSVPGFKIAGLPGAPKKSQAMVPDPDIAPSRTLYVNNLNDRIRIPQLKRDLQELFEAYGNIKEIFAMRSYWKKGQAFVVFDSIEQAQAALEGLQGFLYQGKPMRLNFSKSTSHYHQKAEGTFEAQENTNIKPSAVRAREEELGRQLVTLQTTFSGAFGSAANDGQSDPGAALIESFEPPEPVEPRPTSSMPSHMQTESATIRNKLATAPNPLLLLLGLPLESDLGKIEIIFRRFAGFVALRQAESSGRPVILVEYATSDQAGAAMNALQNYTIADGHALTITFAPVAGNDGAQEGTGQESGP